MWIAEWSAQDFRNIAQARLQFSPEINVLYGDNAQGKTNVIEGISLFSQGRSFRCAKEREMIRFDAPFASLGVRALCEQDSRHEMALSLAFSKTQRICKKNGVPFSRLSEWIGNVQTVVFCPGHLSLVREGPSVRRSFLDLALLPHSGGYLEQIRTYRHVLEQRNALLRQMRKNPSVGAMMEEYNASLAKHGVAIAQKRAAYLERLCVCAKEILYDLSGKREELSLRYLGLLTEQGYFDAAKRHAEAELARQATLFGAHRDDFLVTLNGKEARSYASQGQQRSIALAMKMAEGELLRQRFSENPIFLLDDVFSELDGRRKEYIMHELHNRQVILTTCDSAVKGLWSNACVYEVEAGQYKKN